MQESREQLRLLAEASFEGISILEDGIIVDVNEQYLEMHQYTREELIGQPVLSIISPRSRQTVADAIRSDNLGPYQLWSCRKDGTEVLVEVRARILRVGNRKLRLFAVLGIIRGHGGGLQVGSTLHVGTRFRIAFPQGALSSDAPVEAVPAPADRAHGTILFIDDEEFLRELFVDAFDHSSIRVLTAKDGEEGIALFRQHRQDVSLIVLDLSMPGMGGEAAFRELRKISQHVKIILSSGYAEEDIMNKFKDLSVTGFIPKPYPWNRLDQLLNKHLHMP